jgi:hypothetical protein
MLQGQHRRALAPACAVLGRLIHLGLAVTHGLHLLVEVARLRTGRRIVGRMTGLARFGMERFKFCPEV